MRDLLGAIVLASPGCLLIGWLAGGLALPPVGTHPLWPDAAFNLSEAAAMRDGGEIVRLITSSEDPSAAYDVRPGFLAEHAMRITPIEAAVAARSAETARILLVNGAAMDGGIWNALRCRAEGDEIIHFLDQRRPEGAILDCDSHGAQK